MRIERTAAFLCAVSILSCNSKLVFVFLALFRHA